MIYTRKSVFISIILVLFIILFSVNFIKIHNNFNSPEIALAESFKSSGAKIVNSEIYFWGSLKDNFDSFDKMQKLAADFSRELGIVDDGTRKVGTVRNDSIQKIDITGVIQNTAPESKGFADRMAVISVQRIKNKDGVSEGFISVNVSQDLTDIGLEETRSKAVAVFLRYGIAPKINSCITGSVEGKLEYNQLNEMCVNIFKTAAARKVEGMRDENLISVSAYSPQIQSGINVNGRKVNLNLAVRYNSYEKRTYIWLATPVITTEY